MIFSCHNINVTLLWLILKRYTSLEDFFLLDSVRYRDDVMTTLKFDFDWSNLNILMSSWYRKLTSSCLSFTIYQQWHTDIEGDITPISSQCQNVYWESISSEAYSVEPRGVLQNRWPAPEFKNTSLLSTSGLLLLNSFDTTSDCLHESFESNVFVGITEIIFCGIIRIYTPRWHVKSNLKNVK